MDPSIRRFDPPWEHSEWRTEATNWIRWGVSNLGYAMVEQPETVHARPWSTVMKVRTDHGNLFFKAGGPTQHFEPGLLSLLNEVRKQQTLPLLAADLGKGWSLLAEGGITLRQKLQGKPDFTAWREILRQYAELQIEMSRWGDNMKKAGVPSRSTEDLFRAYEQILNDKEISLVGDGEDFLTPDQYQKLIRWAPIVREMLEELEGFQIPLSLEHGDLHDANIFAQEDRYKIFDWGDASITHPFFSLLLPIRHLADKLGVSEYDQHEELSSLVDAYLQPWEKFAPKQRLLEAWKLAHHLAKFVRTINWYQLVKLTAPNLVTEYHASVSGWFLEFINHPTERFAA